MKEKVLKIITKSKRKLNPVQIVKEINPNYTIDELKEVYFALESLQKEGYVRGNNQNTYFKNELIVGIVDEHEKGNAHVIVDGLDDIFIPKNMMNGAHDKDKVTVEYIDKKKNEGKITKILERNLGIGEVYLDNGVLKIKALDKNSPYKIVVDNNYEGLVDGLLVKLKYVKNIGKDSVLARVDTVIAHKNAADKDTRLIASEFEIPVDFSNEALEEAKQIPAFLSDDVINEALNNERVRDLRNEIIFTIDGKDTKDIDDAISLTMMENGNKLLKVSIADVSRYVKKATAIWNEAEKRGNSNYLGDKVIPMLPIELSNGICSLNENADRFALTCEMEIDYSGKVVKSDVYKSIIRSRKKMNYDAVEDIIHDRNTEDTVGYDTLEYIAKKEDTFESVAFMYNVSTDVLSKYNDNKVIKEGTIINIPVRSIIKNMYVLSKTLKQMKHDRGELEFVSNEVKFKFNDDGKAVEVIPHLQRDAEKVIEDFMIAANESVASLCPFIFRVHGTPSPKAIDEFMEFLRLQGINYPGKIHSDNPSNKELQSLIEYLKENLEDYRYKAYSHKFLRCMQKAEYSTEPIGHFGIASPLYSHFTSPIRRFSDLLLHASIREFIFNKETEVKYLKNWTSYLTVMAKHVSETERTSNEAEYAMDDMLMAEVMEGYYDENNNHLLGHIDEEYDAVIDSCLPSAFFVLTDNFIEGRVDLNKLQGYYQNNENGEFYTKNGKVALRYGDKVRVKCVSASKERREVDFTLVLKDKNGNN